MLWVRRSTAGAAESASGVQRPELQYADGECAELALRAQRAYRTVRTPFVTGVCACAAVEGRIGRLCSERAACRGMLVGGIERGRCGSRARCGTLRGDLGHAI